MKSYHAGWDHFTPDCGKMIQMNCRVCGEIMEVERSTTGHRGSVAAMSGRKSTFDVFFCKNSDEPWHIQALKLKKAAQETPSAKVTAILLEEAEEVIKTKTPTK